MLGSGGKIRVSVISDVLNDQMVVSLNDGDKDLLLGSIKDARKIIFACDRKAVEYDLEDVAPALEEFLRLMRTVNNS